MTGLKVSTKNINNFVSALEKFTKIADIIDISGSLETKGKKDISKINILLNKAIEIKNEN